jgi:hypothetical protein
MLGLIIFACVVYTLSYLEADAKIFGCSTQSYKADPDDLTYLRGEGVLPFRLWVLRRSSFFPKLLGCYFCMGIWNGPIAHLVLTVYGEHNLTFRNSYFLGGPLDLKIMLLGALVAALVAPATNYVIDLGISYIESRVADPPTT